MVQDRSAHSFAAEIPAEITMPLPTTPLEEVLNTEDHPMRCQLMDAGGDPVGGRQCERAHDAGWGHGGGAAARGRRCRGADH